eukprot:jgi/Undpi1/116/HiC_scaffold_1.g00116.m1
MFTLPMRESQHQCRVVIEDCEHKHLMVTLDYVYSGRIGLNDDNVMPVSALANRYEILPLMNQCEGYMKWRLNPSNVCRHLLAAEDHQCTSMAAFALDYLAVHFDEVHHDNSSDFNALGGNTVLRVLQHDGLTVDEETVFLAVDGWAKSWLRRRILRGITPHSGLLCLFVPKSTLNDVSQDLQWDKLPDEEREFVDRLFLEVRFPLISTGFLYQVVEKSAVVADSLVVQRLLHEAYRFQAIRPDAADVDEHFPGNPRVKYRGHERVLFGEGDGCVGTVDDYSSSVSEVHLVENVQRRDGKYWLPGQPEEAYFCVRLDRVRRITKFRFQNRYSEEFEVAVRRTRREEWQVIVPRQPSGGHKDVKELDLTRKRVKARHVKISLRGRKRSCYNTSLYWTELLGF